MSQLLKELICKVRREWREREKKKKKKKERRGKEEEKKD